MPSAYEQLQALKADLYTAEQAAKKANEKYKALEAAWKADKEVQDAAAARKAAADRKDDLDAKARDLLAQYHRDSGVEFPDQHFSIQEDWSRLTITNPDELVSWLIDEAPFLARKLLTINVSALDDLFALQDGTRKAILGIPAQVEPTLKTTIHWSRLPAPAKSREDIKLEVAAECRTLLESDIVIMDTETTGIDNQKDEPVSIAVIDKEGNTLINTRLKPTDPARLLIRSKKGICAADISGIRPEHLENEPTFDTIVDQVNAAFDQRMVIVYNDPFDKNMCKNAARARSVTLHEFPTTCAMDLYGRFEGSQSEWGGGYKWWKLTDACASLGIDTEGAHDALADTKLTLELLKAMAAYQPEKQMELF